MALLPYYHPSLVEAGCDEAGRGCLAGSVYAAAVILPPDYSNPDLNDSKQLTEKRRYALREVIQRDAIAWAVGIVTAGEIGILLIFLSNIHQQWNYRFMPLVIKYILIVLMSIMLSKVCIR